MGGFFWKNVAAQCNVAYTENMASTTFSIYVEQSCGNIDDDDEATDLVRRLGKINQHGTVVRIMSFCVVPDIVAVHTVCVLVYEYVPTGTCRSDSNHKLIYGIAILGQDILLDIVTKYCD